MITRVIRLSDKAVLAAYAAPKEREQAEAELKHLIEVHGYAERELEITEEDE